MSRCRCHEGSAARCDIHTQADFDAQRSQPQAASSTQAASEACELAAMFDWWLRFNAMCHDKGGTAYDDDTHVIAPEWPRRGNLKKWIEILRAASSTTPGSTCPTPSACRFHDECLAGSTGAVDAAMVERACVGVFDWIKQHSEYIGDPNDSWHTTADDDGKTEMAELVRVALTAALAQPAQQGERGESNG